MSTRLSLAGVLVAVGLSALLAAPAPAATYQVRSCAAAPGAVNNAWLYSDNAAVGQFEHGNGCGTTGHHGGLWLHEDLDPLTSPTGAAAYWTFTAPAQTSISALTYTRYLKTLIDPDWRTELRTDAGVLEECVVPASGTELCERGSSGGGTAVTFNGLAATQLRVGARCASTPQTVCEHGASLHSVEAILYSATVTITDTTAPAIGALSGSLTSGGWLRATHTASISASDATGIDTLEFRRGAGVAASDDRACDYTRPAPCAAPSQTVTSDWGPIDTSQWPDGEHTVTAAVRDAAGNLTATPTITVRTDNTPPAAAENLTAAGGDGWSSQDSRQLSWTLPDGQASPIAATSLRLCQGASCTTSPADSETATSLRLTGAGEWTAAVALTDEAGNRGGFSAPVTLRYDPDPPPAPTLGSPQQNDTANDFHIPVSVADPGPAPIVELEGELCRPDGSQCSPLGAQSSTSEVRTAVPAPGSWQLRVGGVDAAGNVGPAATATLTYTAPQATPTPEPNPSPQPTLTPSPQPTATPSPTPTPTVRRRPALRITKARLRGRRLEVRGTLPRDATGRVTLRVRIRANGRERRLSRSVRPRAGRFRATFRVLRRHARRGRLRARFAGDARYRPRTVTHTLRR